MTVVSGRSSPRSALVLLAALALAAPSAGQESAPAGLSVDRLRADIALHPSYVAQPVRLLIVGTYHFANPGQDVVNARVDDVRSPGRQAEIERVLADLSRFQPTVVALERVPELDSALQARYGAIRAGAEASASETEQLGMRLAARLGLDRVHGVDYRQGMDFDRVFASAAATDPEAAGRLQPVFGAIGAMMQALVDDRTIGEALLAMNDPELGDVGHGLYVDLARVGDSADPAGADVVAGWYARNLHIFANLARVARPGDRVVLVIGAGHEPLIRHYASMTPGWRVERLSDWLRP